MRQKRPGQEWGNPHSPLPPHRSLFVPPLGLSFWETSGYDSPGRLLPLRRGDEETQKGRVPLNEGDSCGDCLTFAAWGTTGHQAFCVHLIQSLSTPKAVGFG